MQQGCSDNFFYYHPTWQQPCFFVELTRGSAEGEICLVSQKLTHILLFSLLSLTLLLFQQPAAPSATPKLMGTTTGTDGIEGDEDEGSWKLFQYCSCRCLWNPHGPDKNRKKKRNIDAQDAIDNLCGEDGWHVEDRLAMLSWEAEDGCLNITSGSLIIQYEQLSMKRKELVCT